jgi:hypothetical protein
MTKPFSQYLAERPAVAGTVGTGDKLLVVQSGVLKTADPAYTAVTLDTGGSGKRCLVQATFVGLADDGVTDIWNLTASTV